MLAIKCYECFRQDARSRWPRVKKNYRSYEKTKNGFLMRTYRNMKSRVTGVQKKKAHLYIGKTLLAKEDFYEWSLMSPSFHKLFDTWKNSDHDRKMTPSIDRIDASKGYEIKNMQWITHSENSSKGALSKKKKS